MKTKDWMIKADSVIAATYLRTPVVFTRGEGCTLWDNDGKSYTDFVAGIAVCNLGHAHPRIAHAMSEQAGRLLHVSNLYYTVPQIELASWLVDHSFADRVFFCNSGAEANEAAIKLARKYFRDKKEDRFRIISMEMSFHGRTMATLSATGQGKIKKGFDPVLDGFDFVPFNDIDALEKAISPQTCAVLMEPIQGEGGIRCPDPGYLEKVRQLCDEAGLLLILDEIQTGMGRTGKLFAHEHFGIKPDIMTLAKALGNGLPIGAMLTREDIGEAFGPGAHATTFGGTPIVTAAALETVRILEEEKIVERSAEMGRYFAAALLKLKEKHPVVTEIRGYGLMLGMELGIKGDAVIARCLEKGFVLNCIQEKVIRLAPPLIIGKEQIDSLMDCLDEVLGECG